MLTALTTSFVGAECFDKSSIFISSHFPCQCFILPCLHTLLLTRSPLLTCLISIQLLCHLLSHLLVLLESTLDKTYFLIKWSPPSITFLPPPITAAAIEFFVDTPNLSDPWKMNHDISFIFNQIFLHSSHIVVVRNKSHQFPITPNQLKIHS